MRYLEAGFEYDPRPKHFLNVRQMFHELTYTRYTRVSLGQTESWRLFTAPINWTFDSGDRIEFNYGPQFERLFAPFEISDGVILPAGDYRTTRWRAEFGTASKRRWRVEGTWWFGTYWSSAVQCSGWWSVASGLPQTPRKRQILQHLFAHMGAG